MPYSLFTPTLLYFLLKSKTFSFGSLAAAVGLEIAKPSVPDVALQTRALPAHACSITAQLSV